MVRLSFQLLKRYAPEYWKRYTERAINRRSIPARYVALRGWVGEDKRFNWKYTYHHPATMDNQSVNENHSKNAPPELIEPIEEWTIQLGDRVEVLVGRDKGKQSLVNAVVPERNWVFVEGLNLQYQSNDTTGSLVPETMPLDVTTEVALVDPTTQKAATKVEWRYTETGEKVRVLFPSEAILNPPSSQMLPDGVIPSTYINNTNTDTTGKELETTTYKYNLKTFEEDVMDSLGIKETKQRGKTYWY